MRSLFGVELTRLRWRRAVLFLLAAAVLLPTLIAITRIWDTRPVSEEEQASVRERAAGEIEACEQHPRRFGVPRDQSDRCEDMVIGWYTAREPLNLAAERQQGSGLGVATVLVLMLLLAGTTFAGHDWNSGSMSNQLLFEPRRARVWLAKAVAVGATAAVVALVVITAYWLVLYAVARARDLAVADGVLVDCLQFGLRTAGFAAGAAIGGYALTMLFRSTVATLGILFAVSLLGGLMIGVLGISPRWQPQVNAQAVLLGKATYYVEVPAECMTASPVGPGRRPECRPRRSLSDVQGGAYYGGLLVLASTASVLSFRRRDVP